MTGLELALGYLFAAGVLGVVLGCSVHLLVTAVGGLTEDYRRLRRQRRTKRKGR